MWAAATGPRIEDLDIRAVWLTLGGGPLRTNRGRAWFRDGDGHNVQLYPDTGTWHDFATGTGGGILALVEVALGCDRRGALEWLAQNFGVAIGDRKTAGERAEFARRRDAARTVTERLIERRDEVFDVIREAKRKALEEYHAIRGAAFETGQMDLLREAEYAWATLEALDAVGDALLRETDAAKLERMLAERRAA